MRNKLPKYSTKFRRGVAQITLIALLVSLMTGGVVPLEEVLATGELSTGAISVGGTLGSSGELGSGAVATNPGNGDTDSDSSEEGNTEGNFGELGSGGAVTTPGGSDEDSQDSDEDSQDSDEDSQDSDEDSQDSDEDSQDSDEDSQDSDEDSQNSDEDSQGEVPGQSGYASAEGLKLTLPSDNGYEYVVDIALFHYDSDGSLVEKPKGEENIVSTQDVSPGGRGYYFYPQFVATGVAAEDGKVETQYQYVGYVGTEKWDPGATITMGITAASQDCTTLMVGLTGVAVHETSGDVYKLDFSLNGTLLSAGAPQKIESTQLVFTSAVTDKVPVKETAATFSTAVDVPSNSYTNPLTYLNHYNIVSLNEIEASHVIGPIIALDHAARNGYSYDPTHNLYTEDQILVVGDYTQGVPSYVGRLLTGHSSSSTGNQFPAFRMNYDYDLKEAAKIGTTFYTPNLYTEVTNQGVFSLHINNEPQETVGIIDGDGYHSFVSPNNGGENNKILQNDSFIDESTLKSGINTISNYIYNHGVINGETSRKGEIIILTDNDLHQVGTNANVLEVVHGKSYLIESTKVEYINFITNDYKYGEDYDDTPTTMNFDSGALKTATIGGASHTIFPKILMDDGEMPTPAQGASGEYNEKGNRIIWNLPYVSGILSFGETNNIPGHLIAPNADIRHYYQGTNLTWGGGNINGMIIANSIHTGIMEVHMWPYGILAEPDENPTKVTLTGKKIVKVEDVVEPDLSKYDWFGFTVERMDTLLHHVDYDTLVYNVADGSILFPFTFYDAGTYVFQISEKTPDEGAVQMVYDKSVYQVTFTVTEANITQGSEPAYTIQKIKNADGVEITPSGNTDISFTNKTILLPETGGGGTATTIGLGSGFMVAALLIFILNNKKKVGER